MGTGADYREWEPPRPLARHVACTWAGRLGDDGVAYTEQVLPDGCIDLVWDGERLFVAGPDTGPVPVARRSGGFFVGLRFRPGAAPTFLGVAASDLLDQRVDGSDVLGHRADRLAGTLAAALGDRRRLRDAALVFEREALGWRGGALAPDPLVEAVVASLGAGPTSRPVATLASELGVGERRLHRSCTVAVGYGPKTLDRVLRFRRFLSLAESRRQLGLASLAVEAGYADQAHLSRECQRLAGTPPAGLVRTARQTPGQRSGLASAQAATARAGERSSPARHESR